MNVQHSIIHSSSKLETTQYPQVDGGEWSVGMPNVMSFDHKIKMCWLSLAA
jgi:hypothetical protein